MPLAWAARAASPSSTCSAPTAAISAARAGSGSAPGRTASGTPAGEPAASSASPTANAWRSSARRSSPTSGAASGAAQRAAGSNDRSVGWIMMRDDVTFSDQMSHDDRAPSSSALTAARRLADLEALRDAREPLDLLVVGGGVTGAGVALDAAARGLRVALVERRDLAWGTSRWSSKLVHGGLRYLAQGAFGIAMESARERHILLTRTAPHLVHPIVQAVPFTPQVSARAQRELRIGLALGDGLRRAAGTPARELPRARRTGPQELLRIAPGVDRAGLRGALISYDAQLEDDARLVVGLARTAAAHGAHVLTRVAATHLGGDGATLRDELTGATFDVRA